MRQQGQIQGKKANGPSSEPPVELNDTASEFEHRLLVQIVDAIWLPDSHTDDEQWALLSLILAMIRDSKPRNEIEGMLVVQLIVAHFAGLKCYEKAAANNQTYQGAVEFLKLGTRLSSVCMQYREALDKGRRSRQRKNTIVQVHIDARAATLIADTSTAAKSSPVKTVHLKANTKSLKPSKNCKQNVRLS